MERQGVGYGMMKSLTRILTVYDKIVAEQTAIAKEQILC
jgi:hypothetical protein